MITFLITKPKKRLKHDIINNWPLLYREVRDDVIVISCNGLIQDPFTDLLYLWIMSEHCKITLIFKRTECEIFRRWGL